MFKKTSVLLGFLLLGSSVVLANNPFDDTGISSLKTSSNEANDSAKIIIKDVDNNKNSSETKTFQYAVVKGDYLYAIARKLMGNPERWPELVELNKDRYPSLVSNPHMIEVGWVLTIPGSGSSSSQIASHSSSTSNTTSSTSTSNSSNSSDSNASGTIGKTQAKEFYVLGDKAYNEWQEYTEDSARGEWIRKVGAIVKNTNTYGMKKSLIIAQIINESGWMSTHASKLSDFNNVLGINTDMGRIKPSMQSSTWSKKQTSGYNNVTQWSKDGTHIVGTYESMKHYDSIEECIEDYANVLSLYHPECVGNNNIEAYRSFLEGYTPNPNASTTDKYKKIIAKYNLERFDE